MAASIAGEPKRKAARCLFGRPHPGEISQQLDDRLKRMNAEDSRRWNFDFHGGVPIVGPNGEYEFEGISASAAPSFYHEKTIRARKTARRPDFSPVSDTVEAPIVEKLLVLNEPGELFVASTSNRREVYEKPVTRSSTAKMCDQEDEQNTLKQTKLTNYMPVRKRRNDTVGMQRSTSIDEKRGNKTGGANNNKGAPKRPLRFVPANLPKPSKSSVSDTALVSPRSPPAKASRRSRRPIGAGDF